MHAREAEAGGRGDGERPGPAPEDPDGALVELAHRLHSAAIHLLRRVRRVDPESGVTAARLSALSVVVHAGPLRMSDLAEAEQVSAPTMSRMVTGMEDEGLVERRPSPADGRAVLVEATEEGRRILEGARRRRVAEMVEALGSLSGEDREVLGEAVEVLERLVGPPHGIDDPGPEDPSG